MTDTEKPFNKVALLMIIAGVATIAFGVSGFFIDDAKYGFETVYVAINLAATIQYALILFGLSAVIELLDRIHFQMKKNLSNSDQNKGKQHGS